MKQIFAAIAALLLAFACAFTAGAEGDFDSALYAKQISFARGQSYPVYTGPGTDFPRSGGGKGAVSTNGPIEVYGTLNGWALVGYDIDDARGRIGWIDAAVLPEHAAVGNLALEHQQAVLYPDCSLTDDPLKSASPIASLSAGTPVTVLASLDHSWSLVRAGSIWGFVPMEAVLSYRDVPPADVQADIAQRWPGCWLENYVAVTGTPDGDYGFALVRSDAERILVAYADEGGAMRFLGSTPRAVPQAEGPGTFLYFPAGQTVYDSLGEASTSDGLSFTVDCYVSDSEYGYCGATYRWTQDGFRLIDWYDHLAFYGNVSIEGDQLVFFSISDILTASVPNTVTVTDLWRVDYETLPKTLSAAGGSWASVYESMP